MLSDLRQTIISWREREQFARATDATNTLCPRTYPNRRTDAQDEIEKLRDEAIEREADRQQAIQDLKGRIHSDAEQ